MPNSPSLPQLPRVELSIRRSSKHPWIYRKMCRPSDHAPGSLVEVFDREGRFAGRGIYNRKSQIAVRLLTENPEQPLDDAFFAAALERAVRFRREVLDLEKVTDAYRVVNSEGDGLSGLVVDRFASFAVVQLYSAGWYRKLKWLLPAVERILGAATVLVKADRDTEAHEGFRVRDFVAEKLGDAELTTIVREGGLRFQVDLRHGHKTGFFCDQREHRSRVRGLASGKRVLDGCTYTGGFALNAALGGAAEVTAVDLDEKAIEVAKENARLNGLSIHLLHADLFDFLRGAHAAARSFDLIVLDPPKLASGRSEVAAGLKRYEDLNALACRRLEKGGTLITCSCSGAVSETRFREAVLQGARSVGTELKLIHAGGEAPDHVLKPEFPEGRYLKVLTFTRS